MTEVFYLIIILTGSGTGTGAAAHHVSFSSLTLCEAAKVQVLADSKEYDIRGPLSVSCVAGGVIWK